MTQRADQADQTAGAGTGPSGDGVSGSGGGYGSGQTGARITLGAIAVVCVVGLVAVLWPDNPASSIQVADRAADMEGEDRAIVTGDAVVDRSEPEVPPATGEEVRPARPDPAATGSEASGEGLRETPPEMNTADEDETQEAEINPADTVEETEDPS